MGPVGDFLDLYLWIFCGVSVSLIMNTSADMAG